MRVLSRENATGALYQSRLLNRLWLSEKAFELELTRPPSFKFKPGQCIRLIHESVERDYSLISASEEINLAICVRSVEGGVFSPLLASAEMGTPFKFSGPHGYFTFRASQHPAIFVATGTGIAPFVSMARSDISGFILLHGVQGPSELYYESLFRHVAKVYVPCLSGLPSEEKGVPGSFHGRVTDYLERHLSQGAYDFYLCGRRDMIRDVTFLVDERFPGSLVYTETFY